MIQHHDQVGHQPLRGSGWYNARRDEWNKNDYLREQAGTAKPFFEVNIGGYSIGGPVVIPEASSTAGTSEKKVYFFASQEFTDDLRPHGRHAHEPADGRSSGAATSRRRASPTAAFSRSSIR